MSTWRNTPSSVQNNREPIQVAVIGHKPKGDRHMKTTTNPNNLLSNLLSIGERVLLVGPPGCAKTARIRTIAEEAKMRLVIFRLSLCERIDFGGCIVPDVQQGVSRALPLEVLADLRTTKEPTLLLFDDLGQGPMDAQAGSMQLFDHNGLSPNVVVWAATNRPQDVAGCSRLCEPLRSRFSMAFTIPVPGTASGVETGTQLWSWHDELNAWCDWALDNGASPQMIAWHKATEGRTLYNWKPSADPSVRMCDYRSWATIIRLDKAGIHDTAARSAAIGHGAAAEFGAFEDMATSLVSPAEVWADPKNAPIPEDKGALYFVATCLSQAVTKKTADPFVVYIERLPPVYSGLAGRAAQRRLGHDLEDSTEWTRWFLNNSDLFEVKA